MEVGMGGGEKGERGTGSTEDFDDFYELDGDF